MGQQMTTDYWYPYLNTNGSWSPAHRVGSDHTKKILPMEFPSAGAVVSYCNRSGLIAWTGSTADLCRHQEIRRRCAVCTAPDDPDRPWISAEYKASLAGARSMSKIEKIMDQAEREARNDGPPDDDRFDWVELRTFGEARSTWVKGACYHRTPAPVDLRTGQLVAWWCGDCGQQFEWDRWPVPDHLWVPLPEITRPPVPRIGSTLSGASSEVVVPSGYEEKFREAMNLAHGNMTIVVLPDGTSYTPIWQNPKMTDDGWPKAWPVRAFLTSWNVVKTSVTVGWPLWLWVFYLILTIVDGVK